jgi:tRNA (guanine37-N1)-methyltransferase
MNLKLNEAIDYGPFLRTLTVPYVEVPKKDTVKWREKLGALVLHEKGIPPIDNKAKFTNKIYLREELTQEEGLTAVPDLPPLQFETVKAGLEGTDFKEILARMLPPDVVVPSSFESLGHVAFLNLRKNQLDYQYTIGKVILDTHHAFRTIVNKSEKLNNVFRTPILELIAGEKTLETEVKEEKTLFLLDVEKVYFCSRLHSERSRVIAQLRPKQVIADVFCGIGPFSIRAANEAGCISYANDLNPECFRYLKTNITKNKVGGRVFPFCMDGRDFLRHIFGLVASGQLEKVDHFYMNLPAIGVDFLDVFNVGEFRKWGFPFLVHGYCFEELSEDEDETVEKVKVRLRGILVGCMDAVEFQHFHLVKNVSKGKAMLCATLRFDPTHGHQTDGLGVPRAEGSSGEGEPKGAEPPAKRIKP